MINNTAKNNLDFFIIASCILSNGAYLSGMMELPAITSFCFICSIALVIIFSVLISGIRKVSLQLLITLILIILATFLTDMQISFDFFRYAIITICILLIFTNINQFIASEYSQKIVVVLTLLIIVITNFMYYVGGLRNKYYGSTQCVYLNFENPNTAGIWLTLFFLLGFTCALKLKKKVWRILYFIAN